MATRTIADGGGNWNVAGTWTENAVPTSADDVVATATSGNLTINAAAACRSIDLTGYVGTLAHNVGIVLSVGTSTPGPNNVALKFVSGMSYSVSVGQQISFVSTSGTQQTVDFGGKTGRQVNFTGAGGSWSLSNNLTVTANVTHTAGTLALNGHTVTVATGYSTTGTTTRLLTFDDGSGNGGAIAVTGTLTVTGSGLTVTPGHGTVRLTSPVSQTVNVGASGAAFANLVATTSGGTLKFTDGTTTTVTNSVTFQNVTLTGTGSAGWTIAMPATQTIDHITVDHSTATGNTAVAGTGSVDALNNVNWTFSSTPTVSVQAIVDEFLDIPYTQSAVLDIAYIESETFDVPYLQQANMRVP
jgi:hypothetical protein